MIGYKLLEYASFQILTSRPYNFYVCFMYSKKSDNLAFPTPQHMSTSHSPTTPKLLDPLSANPRTQLHAASCSLNCPLKI